MLSSSDLNLRLASHPPHCERCAVSLAPQRSAGWHPPPVRDCDQAWNGWASSHLGDAGRTSSTTASSSSAAPTAASAPAAPTMASCPSCSWDGAAAIAEAGAATARAGLRTAGVKCHGVSGACEPASASGSTSRTVRPLLSRCSLTRRAACCTLSLALSHSCTEWRLGGGAAGSSTWRKPPGARAYPMGSMTGRLGDGRGARSATAAGISSGGSGGHGLRESSAHGGPPCVNRRPPNSNGRTGTCSASEKKSGWLKAAGASADSSKSAAEGGVRSHVSTREKGRNGSRAQSKTCRRGEIDTAERLWLLTEAASGSSRLQHSVSRSPTVAELTARRPV
jgi:hypothetical protein